MKIIERISCMLFGHEYKQTERTSLGFMEIYYIDKCVFCGRETIGDIAYDVGEDYENTE